MAGTRTLYVMVSRTDTAIAGLIRAVTRYPYNHVSVTLDPELRRWYSFARYVQDAPLFSGFVCESPDRFLRSEATAPVRIYRVQIPEQNALELENMLSWAGRQDSGLIYNYFDAVISAVGLRLPVPGCHTCLSFACSLLDRQHLNIESLCADLESFCVYEGPACGIFSGGETTGDSYFQTLGAARATAYSTAQMGKLLCRIMAHGFDSYMAHRFHRTVH